MMRFSVIVLAFATSVFANFQGEDLSHLLRNGNLHEPEKPLEHQHGDWNREIIARSPHYTKKVRDSSGLEYDLTYYDTGDANITHGDIALPMDFTEHLQSHADHEVAAIHMLGVVSTSTRSVWPCPIPYVNRLTSDPNRVRDAIAHLERYTRWRFVERTTEPNYMEFVVSSGCSSYIGMIGGRQAINLATGCNFAATMHEIMHAMGIYHEQSRPDRDQYVVINRQNIQAGTENNFDICRSCESTREYDYMSVMHYGATAFSVNRQDTITPVGGALPAGVCSMGQRNGLSYGDTFSTMARFDTNSGCGSDPNPPPYDFDVCAGTGRVSSAPGGTTQTQATTQGTTQATTQTTQGTIATTVTQPGVTNPPVEGGSCIASENTAHQGFPYTGAIAQITGLSDEAGCCEQCSLQSLCQSWTFLEQFGVSYCLLYSTPLSNPYQGVTGYTSGARAVFDESSNDEDGGNDTAYIVGGVVGAGAVVVGGAAAYSRSKKKIGGKSTQRSGYSSRKNDVQKDVERAMRDHDREMSRVAGSHNPNMV